MKLTPDVISDFIELREIIEDRLIHVTKMQRDLIYKKDRRRKQYNWMFRQQEWHPGELIQLWTTGEGTTMVTVRYSDEDYNECTYEIPLVCLLDDTFEDAVKTEADKVCDLWDRQRNVEEHQTLAAKRAQLEALKKELGET